ncbi:MAG: VCBS repeat-containing protein, partial [Candidatus Hydrogenedentales bacterium]
HVAAGASPCVADGDAPVEFERQKIADTVFEAAGAGDFNQDGHIDIVSGGAWWAGPDFDTRQDHTVVAQHGDYYDDFADYPFDVNGDGWLDVFTGGWFGENLRWVENLQGKSARWREHEIAKVGNVERPNFWDIDGDGRIELVPNTPGNPQRIFRVGIDAASGEPSFTGTQISDVKTGHGLGFGDLDGDGRGDLIVNSGWFQQPELPFEQPWPFHQDFALVESASVPVLVHDVDGDGDSDLIVGAGHDYGLWWWEQAEVVNVADGAGTRTWNRHEIELDRSQFHTLELADLDNDGEMELVTGKRWRAHAEGDPGVDDPVGLYYYEINGGAFQRHDIDFGPAAQHSGTGIYLWIEDLDRDGRRDIVAPGKEGLYVFWNRGSKPE